jgi:hypothetical protein
VLDLLVMMRWLVISIALAGCVDSWGEVELNEGIPVSLPLHVGQVFTCNVLQYKCESEDVFGTDCDIEYIPDNWTAEIIGSDVAAVSSFQKSVPDQYAIATFDLIGITPGTTELVVIGEAGNETDYTVTVMP